MKRWKHMMIGLAVWCMMAVPAFAEEKIEVSIPVTISLSGILPETTEDFMIELRAKQPSYPMPEGAAEGIYTMTINGASTKKIPPIVYDRTGIYTYTLYQLAGENENCTYDDVVYVLTVRITQTEDGKLESTVVLHADSADKKRADTIFRNKYEGHGSEDGVVLPDSDTSEGGEVLPATDTIEHNDSDAPKTGDDSAPVLYAVLIAASLGVLGMLMLTRKGEKTEE